MYAIIKTGGKQYRVVKDDTITIDHIAGKVGDEISFTNVLAIKERNKPCEVGTPILKGASVKGKLCAHMKGEKIDVVKFKRRKNIRRLLGHRQKLTKIQITSINNKS